MNISIRKLDPAALADFKSVLCVFESVFEMQHFTPPSDEHLAAVLSKPGFMVFAAFADEAVIGGLTAYILDQYYSTRPLAYIYDLAVSTAHQRKGVGTGLIDVFKAHGVELGFEEVFVQADRVDDHALEFYRKTGVTAEEEVVHFYYTL